MDRLRAADPLQGQALPDPVEAVDLREAIVSGRVTSLSAARRRRRVWVGAAAAAAVATAAAIAVTTSRVDDPSRVGCYEGPSTQASTAVLTATDDGPVEQCRQLWEAGEMDPAVTRPDQVPPLVACVLEEQDGVVGVFPAESCDDVDTSGAPWVPEHTSTAPPASAPSPSGTPSEPTSEPSDGLAMPDYQTDDLQVREALDEINSALLDRCLTVDAAIALAKDTLAAHGIEGWTVGPVLDDMPADACAGFFPDAPDQAVWFTPEEPQPGQTPTGR